jgi:hypothetical protein
MGAVQHWIGDDLWIIDGCEFEECDLFAEDVSEVCPLLLYHPPRNGKLYSLSRKRGCAGNERGERDSTAKNERDSTEC